MTQLECEYKSSTSAHVARKSDLTLRGVTSKGGINIDKTGNRLE